jgi:hypothetical protein
MRAFLLFRGVQEFGVMAKMQLCEGFLEEGEGWQEGASKRLSK